MKMMCLQAPLLLFLSVLLFNSMAPQSSILAGAVALQVVPEDEPDYVDPEIARLHAEMHKYHNLEGLDESAEDKLEREFEGVSAVQMDSGAGTAPKEGGDAPATPKVDMGGELNQMNNEIFSLRQKEDGPAEEEGSSMVVEDDSAEQSKHISFKKHKPAAKKKAAAATAPKPPKTEQEAQEMHAAAMKAKVEKEKVRLQKYKEQQQQQEKQQQQLEKQHEEELAKNATMTPSVEQQQQERDAKRLEELYKRVSKEKLDRDKLKHQQEAEAEKKKEAEAKLVADQKKEEALGKRLTVLTLDVLEGGEGSEHQTVHNKRYRMLLQQLDGWVKKYKPEVVALQDSTSFRKVVKVTDSSTFHKDYAFVDDLDGMTLWTRSPALFEKHAPTVAMDTGVCWGDTVAQGVLAARLPMENRMLSIASVQLHKGAAMTDCRKQQLTQDVFPTATASGDDFIVLGNFNTQTSTEQLQLPAGFVDVWQLLRPTEDGFTWDVERNPLNKQDGPSSSRPDRILLKSDHWEAEDVQLIATEKSNKEGQSYASDHFGVLATLKPKA